MPAVWRCLSHCTHVQHKTVRQYKVEKSLWIAAFRISRDLMSYCVVNAWELNFPVCLSHCMPITRYIGLTSKTTHATVSRSVLQPLVASLFLSHYTATHTVWHSVVPASATLVSDEFWCQAGVLVIEVRLSRSSSPSTALAKGSGGGENPVPTCCPGVQVFARNRTYPVAAACVWNDLPCYVTCAPILRIFCNRMKTYLFSRSFPDFLPSSGHYQSSELIARRLLAERWSG